jgi:predicted metal-dependent peptidase
MSTAQTPEEITADKATLARIARGLRMVTVPLPHLSGLAAAVRVALDDSVPTMGIFASGRLVANRGFTARLNANDLVFVLAHELMHLALRTHQRAVMSSPLEFNYAHDYIINDTLRHALGRPDVPAGGLDMPGARERAAEDIVLDMRRHGSSQSARTQVWEGQIVTVDQAMSAAKHGSPKNMGDVLDKDREKEMFPDDSADQAERERAMRDLAAKGMALAKALNAIKARGASPGGIQKQVRALRGIYRTPWQVALQRWLEGVTPGERTYLRASRRGAGGENNSSDDIVMPGRQRHAMLLNIILDTSASMSGEVPKALGAIADFCEATGVDEVRLLQCDTVVTADDMLSPAELAEFEISGYGGSDMTPAMEMLAEDGRVQAAIIITDGDITYPLSPTPYAVLWAVPRMNANFTPPYGRVVEMDATS